MDDFERTQQGGGLRQPLFAFTLASIGPRRRWKNVVERAQFRADLRRLREPVTGDDIREFKIPGRLTSRMADWK